MIGSRAGLLNEQGNNCIFIGPNSGSSFRRTADSLGENIYIGSNTGTNMKLVFVILLLVLKHLRILAMAQVL